MASRFLVKDRENKPYALVELSAEGAIFFPAVNGAKSWAKWMTEEFAGKKITREQLAVTLDNSMSVEVSVSDSLVEEIKNRASKTEQPEKKDAHGNEASLVPVVSLMDIQLLEFPTEMWRNAVEYKAVAFIADQNKSSFSYEVKRTRAVWDASLSVPGTERRGGFRCPVGTRYGGQITDRFGRNCGWGVARRLANEISDLGERLENVGDRRRERRVARRNERMARRLAEGGAIERGARAVGDALDFTGMGGRQRGGRQRVGEADTVKPVGRVERAARRLAEVADPDRGRGQAAPAARPRNRRGNGLRDSEARRMERELVRPGAERTGPQLGGMLDENGRVMPVGGGTRPAARPRPAAPRRPANPRPARPAAQRPAPAPRDNVSNVPVPAGAPAARESLDDYKLRKYNEHQAEVRRIRERGGRAGFLRREEWERFHGPAVEQAWRDRNPDAPEAAPAAPAPRPRPNAGRQRRTGAAGQNGRRPANRRPRPADQPEAVQPNAPRKPKAPARQFTPSEEAGLREELNQLRQDRDQNVPGGNRDARIAQLERILGEQAAPAPAPPPAPAPRRPRRGRGAPQAGQGLNASDVRSPNAGIHGNSPERFNQKMGHKVVDGVLVPDHVAVGANGINNAADAKLHVKNGGSLDDVPDMLVKQAIFDNAAMPGEPLNGKRFQLKGDPSNGINNRGMANVQNKTYVVIDQVTGKRYIMKSPSFVQDEAVGEQYAGIIGQLAGRPMARVRIIGQREQRQNAEGRARGRGATQNHSILVEHFGDVHGMEVREGRDRPNSPDREAAKHVDFIDAVLGNGDRHSNNYMWAGDQKLPIDHGILPAGNGIIPERTVENARRIWASVSSPQIRQNFRNLSDAQIDNIVAEQKRHWRDVGVPADKVTRNANNMRLTLRNLAQAARE